ncbi:uncharacterized protein KY384_003196 [Bacidia gigantensis]|uniref:uncharacterized protein n=1 Tax=Bacidia gigantensis TaxID=2732470 RepID=UPI001D04B2A1|nr:uncharacterized protein KY384_003196 [Bacidia gigantensis]KAG8531566.1 hypothetical protein KY384_003196 [Bacidia gigantensis]
MPEKTLDNETRTRPTVVPENPDFSSLPPVYVLPTHLAVEDLHKFEDVLTNGGAPLTYDAREAHLILGNISTPKRARLELKWKGIQLAEDSLSKDDSQRPNVPARKKIKSNDGRDSTLVRQRPAAFTKSSGSDSDSGLEESQTMSHLSISQTSNDASSTRSPDVYDLHSSFHCGRVDVAMLEWLQRCILASAILPLNSFILLQGQSTPREASACKAAPATPTVWRPQADANPNLHAERQRPRLKRQGIIDRAQTDKRPQEKAYRKKDRPGWVLQSKLYACERATPANQPNAEFISQLKKIKFARVLTLDEVGVRAYSTSIAAIAAYPYKIESSREVFSLPGCDQKIANLFHEFQSKDGHIQAADDVENDSVLKVLREFFEIWGVGAHTAREFYYDKGWRDLDDIIELGWKSLNRVQQIGLKFYDEFQLKIPRDEVESIAAIISEHSKRITSTGLETIIVGGYRRGKAESGDVDVILSHPDHNMTLDLVSQVVRSLEKEGWITHTLTLNLTNSKRNQATLPVSTATLGGHGFDTLDKALVVWQDPCWANKEVDLAANPHARNPNPHRRVDIIISPWRTVGCAVAGWTSGTTFQRDLRRFAKRVKGWKFDSSGVRDRATGTWIDLEEWRNERTRCKDWKEAERRVFEGMGLEYREPWERCTW